MLSFRGTQLKQFEIINRMAQVFVKDQKESCSKIVKFSSSVLQVIKE